MSTDGSSSDSEVESEGENEVKEQVKALEETVRPLKPQNCIIPDNAHHFLASKLSLLL